MFTPKRAGPLLALVAFLLTLFLLQYNSNYESWRDVPQAVGLGDLVPDRTLTSPMQTWRPQETVSRKLAGWDPLPSFTPGVAKPPGSNYTRTLVISRMSDEDVSWVEEELPDFETAIYVADDPKASLHPPKNKGHEVMIYLTYIVDHYDDLPDIVVFMHAHRWSWHNNDLLDNDAVRMLQNLNSERVQREGYMNLRCHWSPGCPDWMHPGVVEEDANKQEETMMAKCWSEIFPHDPIPQVLAVPCCAQFALSRDRIRTIPLAKFVFYRDWLLHTELSDYISGRIWEYLWQVVFTGQNTFCPSQHVCYCDGYGVCFENEASFDRWFEVRENNLELGAQLAEWREKARAIEEARAQGRLDEAAQLEVPDLGKDVSLEAEIDALGRELKERYEEALERGRDPRVRASASGRDWSDGDPL